MRELIAAVLVAAAAVAGGEQVSPARNSDKPTHERRDVVEAVRSLSGRFARINRKYWIGTTAPKILDLEYTGSVWKVELDGLFHFEHLDTTSSGRWACLYLSDEDLSPLDLALFPGEKEPDWTKCR